MGKMGNGRTEERFLELSFEEFLGFVKVVKMLYGRDVAEKVFTKKMKEWYNVDSESLYNF